MERTLSIIKPDAVAKNLTGAINKIFEEEGLRIVAQKRIQFTKNKAQEFYAVHKKRPFYDDLCVFMSSGPIVVQILEGKDAITLNRKIMGSTDPSQAENGTIRALYGKSIDCNAIHGSDSSETADQEISMLFNENEIIS